MKKPRNIILLILFFGSVCSFQLKAQRIIDVWVNPVTTIAANLLDEHYRSVSAGAGMGRYDDISFCILYDYIEMKSFQIHIVRFGVKETVFILFAGPLLDMEKNIGLALGYRMPYKLLIAEKVIIEPFIDLSYFISKHIEDSQSFKLTLGINFGYRISP